MIFILKLTLNMELIDTPNPNAKKIEKCTKQVPYNFFHIVEGHLIPRLITKKKKARVVMILLTTADASIILFEIFTRFIYRLFIFFNISGNYCALL